jgi:hypothetical protein
MRFVQRPLLPVLLLLLLLVGGIAVARSRTAANGSGTPPAPAGCIDDCKTRQDKMLEKCEALPDARREHCRETANSLYNKCVERCGER